MNLDNSANAVKDYVMTSVEYFKLQAKNFHKDYKTRKLSAGGDIYEYSPKYYDITGIFLDYDIFDDDPKFEFSLMNAQHLIAKLVGFKSWGDLIKATDTQLEIAKIKLSCFTFDNYDPSKIEDYEFWVSKAEEENHTHFDDETLLMLAKYYILGEGQENVPVNVFADPEPIQYEEINAQDDQSEQPVMVECLHCGERFLSNETKLIRPKGDTDSEPEEVCKHWPKCNGKIWDLIPVDE